MHYEWSLEAYRYVIDLGDQLWRSYFNSFVVTIAGTLLSVLVCVLYSYALFRKDFKYRRFFTFFAFFTMMFGGGLAPTYMVCKNMLQLSDSYAAMIVPMLVNPFNLIVMRTFFQSAVPNELIEAAKIMNSLPQESLRMALVVLIVIPIACAYPFFQRFIISGLTIGSVKG